MKWLALMPLRGGSKSIPLKNILEIFNAEGVEPPPQIKEIRDYVDFIDNENPNDKGRDD